MKKVLPILFLLLLGCRFFRSKEVKNEVVVPETNPEFIELKKYFTPDSLTGELNARNVIPDSLVNRFLSAKNAVDSDVHPVTYIINDFGKFIIVQVPCKAELYCKTYHLFSFKPDGTFVSDIQVGHDIGKEGSSELFQYHTISDTQLVTYRDRYDEATDRHLPPIESTYSLTLQ